MMGDKKKFLVQYHTDTNPKAYIVVWCTERSEVRTWLKRHLGNVHFNIDRITEEVVK